MSPTVFGMNVSIGLPRKDGKYPVRVHFASTGSTVAKIMTRDAVTEFLAKRADTILSVRGAVR